MAAGYSVEKAATLREAAFSFALFRQIEAVRPQPRGEVRSFRRHRLARFVLRPSVELGDAKYFGRFLPVLERMPRVAPPVIGVNGRYCIVVVAVAMHGRFWRQAHADET